MSATDAVPPPAATPPKQPPRVKLTPVDREFLPAALEILETPPSPVRMWLMLTICAFATAAIYWAFLSRIDIISVAQGKIQSVGRVKLVQPVETAKVRAVNVANGAHVSEGDVLVVLDDSEARADEDALVAALAANKAEALRRGASIVAAKSRAFTPPVVEWPADIPAAIAAREQRILLGDLAQLSAALESLRAQRDQKQAERARLDATISSQETLLDIEQRRVDVRSALEKEKLGSKLNLLDAQEQMQQQRTSLAQQKGQLAEATANIEVIERDIAKSVDTFIAENAQKLADAEKQAEENGQRLNKARVKTEHMLLRAPVSGVVQGMTITSIGQVVMPGEEVMRVVPDGGGFEIESYMPNKDIGFVSVGQEAVVKIESYPFTRFGVLKAKVASVGTDAIPEPDAAQRESDPGKAQKSTLTGGATRTQNLYFPVLLKPEKDYIGDDEKLAITNGMAVTVEIKTGDRRVIDYLFSPLVEVGSRALRER